MLQALWAAPGGRPTGEPPFLFAGVEQHLAIRCESPSPGVGQFPALAARESGRADAIGQVHLWMDEPCATWPAHPAGGYHGPWDTPTAAPILLVGITTDSDTPYASSVLMAAELANARLLTLHGYGHTAILNPSTCVNNAEVAFSCTVRCPPSAPYASRTLRPSHQAPNHDEHWSSAY